MICLVTILKKKISLTCTLYSHVSFVFELAHGCISYVCWPHKVASFFFLHKRNIEPSHRSLCNIVLSGTKQIFKLRRLLCSFSWVHVALKDFLFKGWSGSLCERVDTITWVEPRPSHWGSGALISHQLRRSVRPTPLGHLSAALEDGLHTSMMHWRSLRLLLLPSAAVAAAASTLLKRTGK